MLILISVGLSVNPFVIYIVADEAVVYDYNFNEDDTSRNPKFKK